MSEAMMSDRPLAIITTRLPPATCGVGAHSALLRKHWPVRSGPVEFLVVDEATAAHAVVAGDRITQFDGDGAQLARALDRLGAADVVLHYAARGYQRWGCPIWLPGALAQWKRKFRDGRLLVFVHEVPGALPMTSRHHWLAKVNAWILRRLAATSDIVVTNTESHREKLRRISGRTDIQLVPVGSNIDDAGGGPSTRTRTEFVVFGLPYGRWQTLRMFDDHVPRWLETGALAKLHIIGPDGDEFTRQADRLLAAWEERISVVRHGRLPSAEVSRVLHGAQFALTNVTPETWSKSGAFMACALHGCAPVVAGARAAANPLACAVAGDEVDTITAAELQRRAETLRAWYGENADWPVVSARLAALLGGVER